MTTDVAASVCARVAVALSQDVTLVRTAFQATLEVTNAHEAASLRDVEAMLSVVDEDGFPSDGLFDIDATTSSGVGVVSGGGMLAPGTTARAVWRLAPLDAAAPRRPVRYFVGGRLRYTEDDARVSVSLFPAAITVLPEPRLVLRYYLQREVYGDDPFTDVVEAAEPFTLGLLVVNEGFGAAKNLRVGSFQPRVGQNEKGLLVDFQLVGVQVGAEEVAPALELKLGNLQAEATVMVRWLLTSSLQGQFTGLNASFQHLDGLGDARSSVIERVETYALEHVVSVTSSAGGGAAAFLVNSRPHVQGLPDQLHLADGVVEPVSSYFIAAETVSVDEPRAQVRVEVPSLPRGWVYLRLDDPAQDGQRLLRVIRSDGREVVLGDNAWTTSRTVHTPGEEPVPERRLHLFDRDSTGSYTLIYGYAAPAITRLDPPALVAGGPSLTLTVDGAGFVGGSTVQWNGADRATTYVSPTQLRAEIPASDLGAPGSAQITVTNPAESGGASRPARLLVNAAPDTDVTPPTSAVQPLFEQTTDPSFTVSWSGADEPNGSGLKDFDVFVAEDDGPYTPWLRGVTRTSSTYSGDYGRTYRFYSVARDSAGNVEAAPDVPDAVTRVSPAPYHPAPVVRSLTPASVLAGSPGFLLTVNGADFVDGAVVQWNGEARPTTFGSSAQLTAAITAADLVAAGSASVTVVNPGPGGGPSDTLAFAVLPATGTAPVLLVTAAVPRRVGSDLVVDVTVVNSVAGDATHVRIADTTRLNEVPTSGELPGLGTLSSNGGASTVSLTFPGTAAVSGSRVTLHVDGTSDQGTFTGSRRVNVP